MTGRLQAALLAVDESVHPRADYSQRLVAAKCRGLLRGYEMRWAAAQDAFSVIGIEETLTSDLWNPETGKKSRTFTVAGKLDVRAIRGNRTVLVDHKTCSEDITDPNAPYWRQLIIEAQPSHYMLLEWLNGRKIDEAVWDVVRKPGISPKKLTAAEQKTAIMTAKYCGASIDTADILSLQQDGRETLAMYEARLAQDCSDERPEWYFQRRAVPRLDQEIVEYAQELWEDGQDVLHVRNTKRHRRNPGACMNYGRPCQFLGICSGHDTPDSNHWMVRTNVHEELPEIQDGRGVLTNSRLSVFRTCRRKHFYEYELGIERVDETEAEALFMGTLWHTAQAAWWGFQLQKENEHGNATGSPVSETGTALSAS